VVRSAASSDSWASSLWKSLVDIMVTFNFIDTVCDCQVAQDIEELRRLCQLTTRPYVRQLLQHESEKLSHSCTVATKPVDSASEQAGSMTDAVAAAAENVTQHSAVTEAANSAAAVTNPCIAVTRSAPQRYYKEITTYGQKACKVCSDIFTCYIMPLLTRHLATLLLFGVALSSSLPADTAGAVVTCCIC